MLLCIRKHRKRLRLTQEELAHLLGVSRVTVAMWETGKSNPSLDKLSEIAAVLRCHSVDELFREQPLPDSERPLTTLEDDLDTVRSLLNACSYGITKVLARLHEGGEVGNGAGNQD